MKVCFVSSTYPSNSVGGVAEVVYSLQKCLRDLGVGAYVFTAGRGPSGMYPEYGHTIATPGGVRSFLPMSTMYYLKKIVKMNFDIVNIHLGSGIGIVPLLLANKRRTKVVTTIHTSFLEERRAIHGFDLFGEITVKPCLDEYFRKYVLNPTQFLGGFLECKISDRIVSVCERTKRDCARDYGLAEDNISVIYNGVDLERFNPGIPRDLVRAKYSIGRQPVILWVGRSREVRKGLFFLLYSLRTVVAEVGDVKLIVVGGGHAGEMNTLVERLGIKGNVAFADKVPSRMLPLYYAACDLVVFPSLQEGFPLVVLEAMASGRPVIASRVGGIPEAVEDGKTGILFGPGDIPQLTRSIILLLKDHHLREQMGAEARKIAERKYEWKQIAHEYLKEFEDVSAGSC